MAISGKLRLMRGSLILGTAPKRMVALFVGEDVSSRHFRRVQGKDNAIILHTYVYRHTRYTITCICICMQIFVHFNIFSEHPNRAELLVLPGLLQKAAGKSSRSAFWSGSRLRQRMLFGANKRLRLESTWAAYFNWRPLQWLEWAEVARTDTLCTSDVPRST